MTAEDITRASRVAGRSGGRGGLLAVVVRRLGRNRMALIGAVLTGVFILVALLAPLIAPFEPDDCSLDAIRPGYVPGPSAEHWFGLDTSGCDEFSRIIYGARQSLLVAVLAMLAGTLCGIALGVLAGALRGWVDSLVMRVVDIMLSVPGLLFAIGVAAAIGASLTAVIVAIAVVNVPIFARLLRGAMLSQVDAEYVTATRALGVSEWKIVFRHILPNSVGPVVVQATLTLATAIIDAAGLSFLGLGGSDPRVPEWGRMLTGMQKSLSFAPQLAFFPGAAILVAALGFTLLGESLRESLDPKYRR